MTTRLEVGAPLLVLARPVTLLLRTLPRAAARDLAAGLRSPLLRRLVWPPLAFAAFVGPQLAFHLTPLFWDALREEGLHVAEHVIFLLTALWLWMVSRGRAAARRLVALGRVRGS